MAGATDVLVRTVDEPAILFGATLDNGNARLVGAWRASAFANWLSPLGNQAGPAGLPDEDGLSLTRRLRAAHPNVGIITTTKRLRNPAQDHRSIGAFFKTSQAPYQASIPCRLITPLTVTSSSPMPLSVRVTTTASIRPSLLASISAAPSAEPL